jgi:putative membrane protein
MRAQRKIISQKYPASEDGNTTLRDKLAYDRTILALERTLLAYTRTFFILLATGITFLKLLSDDPFFKVFGIILLPLSVAFLVFGALRFILFRSRLKNRMK